MVELIDLGTAPVCSRHQRTAESRLRPAPHGNPSQIGEVDGTPPCRPK